MIDLTGVAVSVVGGVFSVIAIVVTALVNSHVKDRAAASTLAAAVQNALGAMQMASTQAVGIWHPGVILPPGFSPKLATGVSYVLTHAGPEAARFGITPEAIADKINAQLGLQQIRGVPVPLSGGPPHAST